MATTKYTGYTSSNLPATVTTTPDYASKIPKEDLASFQKANPGLTFGAQDYAQYNKAVSPTIDAARIGTTTVTPVPTPPAPVVNPNQATQIANYTASSADTATSQEEQKLQAEADAQKARAQSQMTDLAQAQSALGGKAGDLATAYGAKDETGQSVNTLAAQLRQLNAQAQGLQLDTLAKQQAEMNKATGQNITQQAVTRNTADATRENLINMATIGIKSAIAKADYDTAKSYADQIVEAKYSGMEADLASKKTQLEWAMQQDLAPAQKKLADEQARQIKKQDAEIADKKAQEKQVSDLVINASTQGAPQALRDKAMQAKTPMEAANILGEYAGEYLKNVKLKAEISRIAADTRKQNLENAALGVPANVQNKIAANINAGKIFSGQIVSKATGDIPKNISQDKVDGLLALKDLTKKVSEYSALYEQMGGAGLYQGVKSKVLPSSTQSQMEGLRSEIVDLLARARSGAALTAYETEQYENKLPGTFNTTFGLGTQGTEKLKSFSSSLNGTLNTKLNGYGATFATTPEEDYLDAVEKASSSINYPQSQVSSYTQSLMTP